MIYYGEFVNTKVANAMGIYRVGSAYGSNEFLHTDWEIYDEFRLLTLMYADDLVVLCDNTTDLEIFIRIFEETTHELGLTMNI